MNALDVSDCISELSRAVMGLCSLLYGKDPVPVTGGELASLLLMLQREVEVIGNVISDFHSVQMKETA